MVKKQFYIGFTLVLVFMAWSCAQIGRPGGGDDDTTAPTVSTEGSTPNSQTRFADRKIELTFDEWISVKNTTKEIFVSPPLNYPLKVTDRGKKVIIEFNEEEVLKENTTYQINFGKSISDLTAGNLLEDYTFKFATGDVLDELEIEGSVIDYETRKGVEDVMVMLHDNLSDTSFTNLKPTYLARTDKEGKFKLQNLRADTFQIYALVDGNVSYTYDLQSEKIAFSDSLIILEPFQAPLTNLELELFDEDDEPRFVEARQREQGLVKVLYQPPVRKATITFLEDEVAESFVEESGDTLLFWHRKLEADSFSLVVAHEGGVDTAKVRKAKKSIVARKLASKAMKITQKATDTIKVDWNKPLASIDTSRMTISDTTQSYPIVDFGVMDQTAWFQVDLADAASYEMKLDSASFIDWYGQVNEDSLLVNITTINLENLGVIKLSITKEDSIVYLLDLKSADKVIESWTILESQELTVTELNPGAYSLSIVQDSNKDGRQSSGNLEDRKRPEQVREMKLENLKAGWELESTLDITELFYDTKGK